MGICLPKGLSRSTVSQVDIDDVFVPPSGPQSLKLFTQVPIVLLGLPNSGKSTIIKHWKLLSEKMTKEDILLQKEGVHEFILFLFKTIISIMEKDSRPYEIAENKSRALRIRYAKIKDFNSITEEMIEFYKDARVKELLAHSSMIPFSTATFFLENISRFSKAEYEPTIEDILKVREVNAPLKEVLVPDGGQILKLLDIGDKKIDKNKWIEIFKGVSAVIFCVDLSGFDYVYVPSNPKSNQLSFSMETFKEILESKWLKNAAIILWFNKVAAFKEKLAKKELKTYFPGFEGSDAKTAMEFIKEKFLSLNSTSKEIHASFIDAMDSKQMRAEFDKVTDLALSQLVNDIAE